MISKSDTQVLKGVAILFMLYLHLFNQPSNVALCKTFISIGGEPVVSVLARCTNPVYFFIILSGYGLYISHKNGRSNNYIRVARLYIHYWIVMVLFVTVGYFIRGSYIYPGSLGKVLENITGWNTSYNGEMWFLFPYMMIAITSKWIFTIINRFKWYHVLAITGILYVITNVVVKFATDYIYSQRVVYMLLQYIVFLFVFCIGAIMAKHDIIKYCKISGWKAIILLLILIITNAYINKGILLPLYVTTFIVLFVKIRCPVWLDNMLGKLGRRSTSIWFVHSYFCYYLFKDFIYGFQYPIAIFTVLLTISYLTAIIIDWLNGFVQKKVTNLLLR